MRRFDLAVTCVCCALLGYFAWHAWKGPRGYPYQHGLEDKLAMLNQNVHRIMLVDDLMEPPLGALHEHDDLAKAMRNFDTYNLKHLPVLDGNGRLAGFLAREDVFNHYRKMLQTNDDL